MGLTVEHEATLVDVAVEVDRELGDSEQGAVDVQEAELTRGEQDPSREAEIAIEPGVVEHTAVDLDGQLTPTRDPRVGLRLHAQVRRIAVGPDDPPTAVGRRVRADRPRHERATACDIEAACRVTYPRRGFVTRHEAGRLEERRCLGDRVVGRDRSGRHVLPLPAVLGPASPDARCDELRRLKTGPTRTKLPATQVGRHGCKLVLLGLLAAAPAAEADRRRSAGSRGYACGTPSARRPPRSS